jgi:hypothetical protein
MLLREHISAGKPVSSRAQRTDLLHEAGHTTDFHLDEAVPQVGTDGLNSSAAVVFFCLFCQCSVRVVVDRYFKLTVCRVPESRLTIPSTPLFQIPYLNTAR